MKLSANQKTILATCGVNADLEITEIAKRCRLPVTAVRYAIEVLRENQVIKKLWIIDTWLLGWSRYNILFSIGLPKRELRENLFKAIAKNPYCTFFTELGGNFDYEISLLAPNEYGALQFFRELSSKFGSIFTNKLVLPRTEIALFPRKYLSSKPVKPTELVWRATGKKLDIDQLDHQLLQALSKNHFASLRTLAQELKVPASTIEYHFRRMREQKIIAGCVYAISNIHYGASSYELQVHAKGFDRDLHDQLYQFAKVHPHCTHFVESFGSADYSIGAEVQTYQQLVNLREQLAENFDARISHIEVLARMGVKKYDPYPFQINPTI